jgi:septal ring factor EnvC (AmiA/AmiB activator)
MDVENQGFLQTISLLSVALIALVIGVQKLVRDWRTTNAESDIISIMHKEIERMSSQNITLSTTLGKLQEEIIELNKQISKLNIENNKLQEEISVLTLELNSFKKLANLVGREDKQ